MNMDIDTTYIIYTFTRTRDHNIADAWRWVRSENRNDGLGHNFLYRLFIISISSFEHSSFRFLTIKIQSNFTMDHVGMMV